MGGDHKQTTSGVRAEVPFADLHFSPAPAVSGSIPGPRSQKMLREQEVFESRAVSYPRGIPVAFESGRGATIRDVDGNTFIDFFAGAGVLNLGHGNPTVLEAATRQQEKLIHALDFPTPARSRLTRALRAVLPGALSSTGQIHFSGPTGSDAVEAAIKLALTHTNREGLIAFHGSYHGMTAGALSVSADSSLPGWRAGPVQFLPYPYPYRSPFGLDDLASSQACIKLLETCLTDPLSGVPKPAAVIVEPIQGEGGNVVAPTGFLKELRRVTKEQDVLLIVDEIQTGFGRTGEMFACNHEGVCPDIIIMSKALSGIGYPLSCIAYDKGLNSWNPGDHIGTFRGNQVAMAAGTAAIQYIADTDLLQHVVAMGEAAGVFLRALAETLTTIGDIRGRGLFIGIELVHDRETKEPWPELARHLRRDCAERGLIVEIGGHFENVIRLLPPLVITQRLLEYGLRIVTDSLRALEASPPLAAQPEQLLRTSKS